jgi:hypothetical protein
MDLHFTHSIDLDNAPYEEIPGTTDEHVPGFGSGDVALLPNGVPAATVSYRFGYRNGYNIMYDTANDAGAGKDKVIAFKVRFSDDLVLGPEDGAAKLKLLITCERIFLDRFEASSVHYDEKEMCWKETLYDTLLNAEYSDTIVNVAGATATVLVEFAGLAVNGEQYTVGYDYYDNNAFDIKQASLQTLNEFLRFGGTANVSLTGVTEQTVYSLTLSGNGQGILAPFPILADPEASLMCDLWTIGDDGLEYVNNVEGIPTDTAFIFDFTDFISTGWYWCELSFIGMFGEVSLKSDSRYFLNGTESEPPPKEEPDDPEDPEEGEGEGGIGGGGTGEPIGHTVHKHWRNVDGVTLPSEVLVQRYCNGVPYGSPVSLTAENGWKHLLADASPEDVWTADEIATPTGFVKEVYNLDSLITLIVNEYVSEEPPPVDPGEPETPAPTEQHIVYIVWNDVDTLARPTRVFVQMYAGTYPNGTAYGSPMALSEENGWSVVFDVPEGDWYANLTEAVPSYGTELSVTNYSTCITLTRHYSPEAPEIGDAGATGVLSKTYTVKGSTLKAIANAIRTKTRKPGAIKVENFALEISSLIVT